MAEKGSPFADIPRTARGHLGLVFYEAVFRIIGLAQMRAGIAGKSIDAVFEEYPFLAPYFAELRPRLPQEIDWANSLQWLEEEIAKWESDTSSWLPLRALREALRLSRDVSLGLILIGLVEEESSFGSLFANFQGPGGPSRPSLGLVHTLLGAGRAAQAVGLSELSRGLVDSGLTEVINPAAPRTEWILRVSPAMWQAICGDPIAVPLPGTHFTPPQSLPSSEDSSLAPSVRLRLPAIASLLSSGDTRALVVRGMPGCDRLAVADAILRLLEYARMEVDASFVPGNERWRLLGPILSAMHAIPVFTPELAAGETFALPQIAGYSDPIVLILGREGGFAGPGSENSVTIQLEIDPPAARRELWQRCLGDSSAEDLAGLTDRFILPARYLRQAGQLAKSYASVEGRKAITVADVQSATRAINRQQLDALATPLDAVGDWAHLIVSASTATELSVLERRCRHRERLATAGREFPGGLGIGVRALLEGPSGTGKTLAARTLAAALDLDLYRIDLSAIVNKYVGETEKNLSRVLCHAEDLNVILLLDEGDALLARRTDVRSSHDRYANLETNYLLQRLETYTGIVLITTNLGHAIDSAFRRRMDAVVKFYLPDPAQRWQLWNIHLPSDHLVPAAALERIALRHAFTGGQIRNAAVHAALLAIERGSARIGEGDLLAAVKVEYRKAGASFPGVEESGDGGSHESLGGFLRAIS